MVVAASAIAADLRDTSRAPAGPTDRRTPLSCCRSIRRCRCDSRSPGLRSLAAAVAAVFRRPPRPEGRAWGSRVRPSVDGKAVLSTVAGGDVVISRALDLLSPSALSAVRYNCVEHRSVYCDTHRTPVQRSTEVQDGGPRGRAGRRQLPHGHGEV